MKLMWGKCISSLFMVDEHKYDEKNISILLTAGQRECLAGAICTRTWEQVGQIKFSVTEEETGLRIWMK